MIRRAIGAAVIGKFTDWYVIGVCLHRANSQKGLLCAVGESAGTIAISGMSVAAFLIHPLGGTFFGSFRAAGALDACFWRWAGRRRIRHPAPANGADCVDKRSGSTLGGV